MMMRVLKKLIPRVLVSVEFEFVNTLVPVEIAIEGVVDEPVNSLDCVNVVTGIITTYSSSTILLNKLMDVVMCLSTKRINNSRRRSKPNL